MLLRDCEIVDCFLDCGTKCIKQSQLRTAIPLVRAADIVCSLAVNATHISISTITNSHAAIAIADCWTHKRTQSCNCVTHTKTVEAVAAFLCVLNEFVRRNFLQSCGGGAQEESLIMIGVTFNRKQNYLATQIAMDSYTNSNDSVSLSNIIRL